MPEQIQSPEMTADWENKLLRIERGEMEPEEFMTEIKEIISSLVNTTEAVKGANALTMSCSGCRTAAWCRGIYAKTCGPRRNTVISDEAVPAKRAGLLSAYAAEAGCRPCAPFCIHALSGKAEHCSVYADLKAQAADVDAVELMDARLDIRPDRERSAAEQVKAAYGEKYDPLMMYDSKRDVADLLNEEAETRSVRDFLRQKQKAQQTRQQRKPKRHEQER